MTPWRFPSRSTFEGLNGSGRRAPLRPFPQSCEQCTFIAQNETLAMCENSVSTNSASAQAYAP